ELAHDTAGGVRAALVELPVPRVCLHEKLCAGDRARTSNEEEPVLRYRRLCAWCSASGRAERTSEGPGFGLDVQFAWEAGPATSVGVLASPVLPACWSHGRAISRL